MYDYQVYAINTVGDDWDYSNPAINEISSGGGFPTLTLSSWGDTVIPTIAAPGNLTATAVVKNRKTADVTLNWVDNSDNETGFLVQRADNATFTLGVVNATVGVNITTLTQNLPRARSYYYRVLAFDETTQSGWSNVVNVVTPESPASTTNPGEGEIPPPLWFVRQYFGWGDIHNLHAPQSQIAVAGTQWSFGIKFVSEHQADRDAGHLRWEIAGHPG